MLFFFYPGRQSIRDKGQFCTNQTEGRNWWKKGIGFGGMLVTNGLTSKETTRAIGLLNFPILCILCPNFVISLFRFS